MRSLLYQKQALLYIKRRLPGIISYFASVMRIHPPHIKTVLVHLLFWALYILSEYLANMMHLRAEENLQFFRSLLLSLPILVLSAYFIALYAVPRFLNKNKWALFMVCLVIVALFVLYGRVKWLELIIYLNNDYIKVPVGKVLSNVIRDYAIIALAVCIYIIGDYRNKLKTNAQLTQLKAEAEIKLLKGQLHPHFLFNSLNNLYSLALVKSDLTADSILRLTELLEYLVYRANMDKVALSKEVQLLNNYIELERLRYGDDLQITTQISIQSETLQVAPLLLLPFAENCFKHGSAGADGIFSVDIQLHADNQQLVFSISNSKKKSPVPEPQSGGVGLQNIRQRLALLYPGRHQLTIENQPENYRVKLLINYHEKNQVLHR